MHDSETEATLIGLRNIRRHLTVAFLAVEQVCRKAASLPPVQRLCSFAMDALSRTKDELAGIEARLLHRERREDRHTDDPPEHPRVP